MDPADIEFSNSVEFLAQIWTLVYLLEKLVVLINVCLSTYAWGDDLELKIG